MLLSWSAPSQHHHHRSQRWYVTTGIIVLIIACYGILTGAWTVALVSTLVGGLYFLVRHETPALKEIRIEPDGVAFEGTFTPWSQCKDFWLVQTPLYTELHIIRNSTFNHEIRIQTVDIDPTLIRSTLSQFLTMRGDQRERLVDAIFRLCKL